MTHLHSVPAEVSPWPCETIGGLAHPRLRRYVVGYGGFRSPSPQPVMHRVLPLNLVTLVIDFDGASRILTGPRGGPAVFERTGWRHGVSLGLTPAGATALLGVPMPELVEGTVLLGGRRDAELAERLAAAPDWTARFGLLDDTLTDWLGAQRDSGSAPDPGIVRAWWRLQAPAGRLRVGAVAAELGVSRRYLEQGFKRHIGLPPKTVARIARFQRAIHCLAQGSASLPSAAFICGYADQSHFTREVRAMAGLPPTELRAFLQYRELQPA